MCPQHPIVVPTVTDGDKSNSLAHFRITCCGTVPEWTRVLRVVLMLVPEFVFGLGLRSAGSHTAPMRQTKRASCGASRAQFRCARLNHHSRALLAHG